MRASVGLSESSNRYLKMEIANGASKSRLNLGHRPKSKAMSIWSISFKQEFGYSTKIPRLFLNLHHGICLTAFNTSRYVLGEGWKIWAIDLLTVHSFQGGEKPCIFENFRARKRHALPE